MKILFTDQQKRTEFVKNPYKTTKEFIEETLGPGLTSNPCTEAFYNNYSHCFHNSKSYIKDSNVNNISFPQSSVSSESGLSALHHSHSITTSEHHCAVGPSYSPNVFYSSLLYNNLPNQNMQCLSTSLNAVNLMLPSSKLFQSQVQ